MATIHQLTINGSIWYVARLGAVDVLRNRTKTGVILDCLELGLIVEEI